MSRKGRSERQILVDKFHTDSSRPSQFVPKKDLLRLNHFTSEKLKKKGDVLDNKQPEVNGISQKESYSDPGVNLQSVKKLLHEHVTKKGK